MNKLVKLKPLDYYFFGGEETFDNGAKGVKNFHVKSNVLPQQTGLAGLIRHQLYLAGYPIGKKSFDGSIPQWQSLHSVSPILLINNNNEFLVPCPLIVNHKGNLLQIGFEQTGDYSFRNGKWQENAVSMKGYDAKEGLSKYWLNLETGEKVAEKNIFTHKNHIGINKEKRMVQHDDSGAFYQQEFISLNSDYSFCAFVSFSDDVNTDNFSGIMPFGGEKRSFCITYSSTDTNWSNIKNKASGIIARLIPNQPGIVLLSDTYVADIKQVNDSIKGAILYSKPFRNIFTPENIRNVNFARLTKRDGQQDQLRKSSRMVKLLGKGSVLFPNDLQKCSELLTNEAFSLIGYNHFITIQ